MRHTLPISAAFALLLWAACSAHAQTTEPAPAVSGAANSRASAGPVGIYEDQPIGHAHGAAAPAGQTSASQRPQDSIGWPRLLVALAVVLLLIFALKPFLRRLMGGVAAAPSSKAVQVLSSQMIAPRQQLMLIRLGRRLVLIGNSGGAMNALCEISDPDEVAALMGQLGAGKTGLGAKAFSGMLGRAVRGSDRQEAVSFSEDDQVKVEEDEPAVAAPLRSAASRTVSRDELSGLIEKVRTLSQQFER